MVTRDRCDRLTKTLMKHGDSMFQITENYASREGCTIDFINTKVSEQLSSDELQDSYAHIGSIGLIEDYGYKREYGHKYVMLQGDVPILKHDKSGRVFETDKNVSLTLQGCDCSTNFHEHHPATHVHFICRTQRSIVCATKIALKES